MQSRDFDLETFLPFVLNQAAETTSHAFAEIYQKRYGMTRGQWRVMANLGRFGAMTATEICRRGQLEKTKVSRAVHALEQKGWLSRKSLESDRRSECLSLTEAGRAVFDDLGLAGLDYDRALRDRLGDAAVDEAIALLRRLCPDNQGDGPASNPCQDAGS
ncbi:MarR family transcriptional regulator [Actibacterium sp. MT2.3-13A]|uniref:MarR family winged helix-turn-helix transcriptional regulator n=1 Tax=Actibacterium sp. MT2.3-13A TaxID=2828332 RepID=UPI001BADAA91|nr:MarR family transcriptional regulator [Actibacterium sp. MT2.3-13A]